MHGQKCWIWVAILALLILTMTVVEGGKAEKQGEANSCKGLCATVHERGVYQQIHLVNSVGMPHKKNHNFMLK